MKDLSIIKETMSSLQIAEVTGKRHSDILEAIRVMEPAWEKVAQRKFPLGSYKDANQQDRPCYELSKIECLYIATKFNDEARAKLILRWEQLETEKQSIQVPGSFKEALLLAAQQQEQIEEQQKQIGYMSTELVGVKKKNAYLESYLEIIMKSKNTVTITQVAQDYGMSARAMNTLLNELRIQRKVKGQWILYASYISSGYVRSSTFEVTHKDGSKSVEMNTEWSQKGRIFLYEILKSNNILPLIEK